MRRCAMTKAVVAVFIWVAIVVELALAVLIVQTAMACLRRDSTLSYGFIWRRVTGLLV